eukprot:TRINITY_DN12019_c0_g1_i1.p1 TRINITY_DN12019_c0_g1~~TRINITY_DN12019_c0_g1_i1.p1  ORF type:complete len:490 (+),score=118.46 TRINITY_DN12019_c0_g1_i1:257-1726(+)
MPLLSRTFHAFCSLLIVATADSVRFDTSEPQDLPLAAAPQTAETPPDASALAGNLPDSVVAQLAAAVVAQPSPALPSAQQATVEQQLATLAQQDPQLLTMAYQIAQANEAMERSKATEGNATNAVLQQDGRASTTTSAPAAAKETTTPGGQHRPAEATTAVPPTTVKSAGGVVATPQVTQAKQLPLPPQPTLLAAAAAPALTKAAVAVVPGMVARSTSKAKEEEQQSTTSQPKGPPHLDSDEPLPAEDDAWDPALENPDQQPWFSRSGGNDDWGAQLRKVTSKMQFKENVPRVVYAYWTGSNPITLNRQAGLKDLESSISVPLKLITPKSLPEYVVEGHPLHPGYESLSRVHRADYLRCYFMHHHGGGSADIKRMPNISWGKFFDDMDSDHNIWMYGVGGRDNFGLVEPEEWNAKEKDDFTAHEYDRLVGISTFIFRPRTPLTEAWCHEATETTCRLFCLLRPCSSTTCILHAAWVASRANISHTRVHD